jgi:xanthine dehydrogenase accessory factor
MNDVLKALADIYRLGTPGALCTIIDAKGSTPRKQGSKMVVYPDGSIVGTIGGGEVEARVIEAALESIRTGETTVVNYDLVDPTQGDPGVCGGSLEIFIDPLSKPDDIVVVGGGHVGKAVVFLAKWLGFRVTLSEDREEYCRPEAVPGADVYLMCKLEDLPSRFAFSEKTAVVLATRNNQVEINGLPALLEVPTAYIGLISSKRRWKITEKELLDAGIKKSALERIHVPVGLDIGADTPEEIALSILAEILLVKNGKV